MYHFAHIAAYCQYKRRRFRGLLYTYNHHVAKYYRIKAQTYRWYLQWS